MLGWRPLFKIYAPRKKSAADKDRRGISSIEFAFIAPVFMYLLIGITEVSTIMLIQHILENATYNASRTAKTGYVEENKTQMQTVMDALVVRLNGLAPLIDVAKVHMESMAYASLSNIGQPDQGVEGLGTPGQVVVYTVTYPWEMYTPLIGKFMGDGSGTINLTSRIVVKNEPYE